METEIEAKWVVPELEAVRARLRELKAELVHAERLMRRRPFDFPDSRLEKVGGWVRARDEGDRVTLTYKQLNDRTLRGTQEVSVVVNDFERTCQLLGAIGLEAKSYQETKRETWRLKDCEVTLDTWPWIPPVVELEGGDEAIVKQAAAELGFDWTEALHGSIENVYQKYYNVTEAEVDHWSEVTFVPVPDWLEAKRKT
ncbi:MAG: CYTH domain-containing protein [Candidatus Veblenbacteria bacterium]|nr:CYTH domain-containing protein [Candidatus Veblenbacteria bacterium]